MTPKTTEKRRLEAARARLADILAASLDFGAPPVAELAMEVQERLLRDIEALAAHLPGEARGDLQAAARLLLETGKASLIVAGSVAGVDLFAQPSGGKKL